MSSMRWMVNDMVAKTTSFNDIATQYMRDPERRAGVEAESEKLESAFQLMTARQEAGLSQAELAVRAGVPQSTVNRIEHGANTSFDTMSKLAFALGKKLEVRLA